MADKNQIKKLLKDGTITPQQGEKLLADINSEDGRKSTKIDWYIFIKRGFIFFGLFVLVILAYFLIIFAFSSPFEGIVF